VSGGDCGAEATIGERVKTRSDRIEFVRASPRRVVVRTREVAGAWRGEVSFAPHAEHPSLRRELQAQTCAALLDAVAFVISVTLDPPDEGDATQPSTDVTQGRRPMPAQPTPGEPKADGPSNAGSPPRPAAPRPGSSDSLDAVDEDGPDTSDALDVSPVAAYPRRLYVAVGAVAQWTNGAAPRELFGAGVYSTLHWAGSEGWAPFVSARLAYAPPRTWRTDDGTASFALLAAGIDACPLAVRSGPIDIGLCAVLVGARLNAEGVQVQRPEEHNRPWAFGGGGFGGSLSLPPLEVTFGLRAGKPFLRDAFQFAPQVFYQVPSWVAQADLGFGLVLP
jgi:hypothetical protein